MKKRILPTFLFCILACTSTNAANAPTSLLGKKLLLNVQDGEGSSFDITFYLISGNDFLQLEKTFGGNDWESGNYQWNPNGAQGTFTWGEISGGRMDLSMNFSNSTFNATQTEVSGSQAAGAGTFTISDYTENEIPIDNYFTDDFSNQTKTQSHWGFGSDYGLTTSISNGAYGISGTLNDSDERWPEIGANSLLSLGKDWIVEGSAFTNNGEITKLSIETDIEGLFQLEVHLGISGSGIFSQIQYERYDIANYQEQYFDNFQSTGNNSGTFRIRNSAAEKTFHIEWLDAAEWKNLNSLNWETGILSKEADSSNVSSKTQLEDWQSMENYLFNPQMEFSVPQNNIVQLGDYGFTSFSIIEVTSDAEDELTWQEYDDFSGNSLDVSKWGTMYLGGGVEPSVSNGALLLKGGVGSPTATKVVKAGWENIFQGNDGGQAWVYAKDSGIYGIEAEFNIPINAAQSSGLALGVASLSPFSYATAELNADPSSTSQYAQGFGFYHLPESGIEVERFKTGQRGVSQKLSVTLTDGVINMYVDDEIQYSGNAGNFNVDMFYVYAFNDFQDSGVPFELNADNVRVLRRSQEATEHAYETVLSTPDGKPVVIKEQDTFKWNENLDGVQLWGVWQDDDSGSWVLATVQYENGRQKGALGAHDSLPLSLDVDHPYSIDETGTTIVVTEDSGFQYYQVTSVVDGVINAKDNDSFPLTDESWWFTTRSVAEDYLAAKTGGQSTSPELAPTTLSGLTINSKDINWPVFNEDLVLSDDGTFSATVTNDTGTFNSTGQYVYSKQSEQTATLSLDGTPEGATFDFTLTFADETSGNYSKFADYGGGNTDTTSGPFSLSETPIPTYAPDSLIGQVITHTAGATVETLRFMDADTVLFYESAQDANPGQQQYTYAKTSGTTAQVTVIFDDGGKETTDYVFTGADTATYVWKELSGDMDISSGTAAFADATEGEWLAYDDFSDNSIDAGNWVEAWWEGAQAPYIQNGKLVLGGTGAASSPAYKIPRGSDTVVAAQIGNLFMHSFAEVSAQGVYGIEAEISLPNNSPLGTGIALALHEFREDGSMSQSGIELGYWNSSTQKLDLEFDFTNSTTGEDRIITKQAEFNTSYRVAIVHTDAKTTLYLNDEVIMEVSSSFSPNWYGLVAFNDNKSPFISYADNVKVLWKTEAAEESVGDSSAPAAVTATITAATSSSSQGSVTGGGTFTTGATATLTATATAGYLFSHWSGGYSGTENPLTLTASSDATVTANFAQDGRDSDNDGLSNYDETQRGTDPNDSDTDDDFLTDGLEVEMALNPSVANGSLQEIANAAQTALTNAREAGRQEVLNNPIAYGFVSGGAPVTNATGNGETPMIEGWFYQEASGWQYVSAQTYPYLYRASPSSWLYFQPGSSNPPLLYDFSEERWLTPPANTHMVKVNTNLAEAGSVSGGGTYEEGSSVTLTATPANGYVFVAWSGDASGESTTATLIVDEAKTVTAIFSKITAADVKEVLDDIFGGF